MGQYGSLPIWRGSFERIRSLILTSVSPLVSAFRSLVLAFSRSKVLIFFTFPMWQILFYFRKLQLRCVCPAIFSLVWCVYTLKRWTTYSMIAARRCLRWNKLFALLLLTYPLKSPLHRITRLLCLRLLILMILSSLTVSSFRG